MKHEVVCAHRETGREYRLLVEAPDVASAVRMAAADGHLASRAAALEPPAAAPVAHEPAIDYRAYLSSMNDHLAALHRARLVRYPIGTIVASFIVAMLVWSVLVFVVFFVFTGLLAGVAGMR